MALVGDFDSVLSLGLRRRRPQAGGGPCQAKTTQTESGYTVTGEGDPAIDALVLARYEAKKAKNFAEADRIRDELKARASRSSTPRAAQAGSGSKRNTDRKILPV